MFRILLAEDESPARDRVRRLLKTRNDCSLTAECSDGATALDELLKEKTDILLLDIQMPALTGFEVLAALPEKTHRPAIIFITAYDEHAIQAFEVAALDYLLKPFTPERFHTALDRAILSIRSDLAPTPALPEPLLQHLARQADIRVPVRDRDSLTFLNARAIEHIEAAGNYVLLHSAGQTHIHRETLTSIENRLTHFGFFRVNRSALVNLAHVHKAETPAGGPNDVILSNGTRLVLTCPLKKLQGALLAQIQGFTGNT